MLEYLLPMGTIVKLTGDDGYIMICGRLIVGKENDEEVLYDYAGCEFPVGVTGEDYFLFDHEDIEFVNYIGYQDERELTYRQMLSNAVEDFVNNNIQEEE